MVYVFLYFAVGFCLACATAIMNKQKNVTVFFNLVAGFIIFWPVLSFVMFKEKNLFSTIYDYFKDYLISLKTPYVNEETRKRQERFSYLNSDEVNQKILDAYADSNKVLALKANPEPCLAAVKPVPYRVFVSDKPQLSHLKLLVNEERR